MKKISSYISMAICLFSAIACTSCKEEDIPLMLDEIQDYVQKTYDTKIELVSTDHSNEDYYYTFKDKSGFEFTVYLNCMNCDWWPSRTYSASENYISGYCKAHPEIFNVFRMDNHHFKKEENGDYVLYYDSYDDIDEIAEFTFKYTDKTELPRIHPAAKPESLTYMYSEHEKLYFKPSGSGYDWLYYTYIEFPNDFYDTSEKLSENIKSWHIQQLQRNDDTEHLSQIPDEDINKYGK